MLPTRRALLALFVMIALLGAAPRTAHAQDRRIEASAKEALKHARADFSAADFDGALARLLKAIRACGTIRCSAPTRAALHRDAGVMQLRRGEAAKADASFAEALRLDRRVELLAPYDVPDIRAEWDALLEEATLAAGGTPQPGRLLAHAGAGAARTDADSGLRRVRRERRGRERRRQVQGAGRRRVEAREPRPHGEGVGGSSPAPT